MGISFDMKPKYIIFYHRYASYFQYMYVLILITQVYAQQPSQMQINWQNLRDQSVLSYRNGPGKAQNSFQNALKIEKQNLPGRIQQLYFGLESFENIDQRSAINLEKGSYFQGNFIIGTWRKPMENMIDQQMQFLIKQNDSGLWQFISEIYQNFGTLWGANLKIKHLQEDLEELNPYLEKIKNSTEIGGLSAIAYSDIEIQIGQKQIELSQSIELREKSEAFLKQWLGNFEMGLKSEADIHLIEQGQIPQILLESPWHQFKQKIELLPQIQQIQAEQQTLIARGESLLVSSAPWNLQVTAQARSIAYQQFWWVFTVGINIPIAYPAQAEAARLKSEAIAVSHKREWMVSRQQIFLDALDREYQALLAHITRIDRHLLAPSQKKKKLMDQGFQNGDIKVHEYLAHLINLHEIEHQKLDALIRLKVLYEQSKIWALFLDHDTQGQNIKNQNTSNQNTSNGAIE